MLQAIPLSMKRTTKWEASTNIETTATMVPTHSGMFRVTVIERFGSGNFMKKEHDNLSEVAARGLLKLYGE